jgi:8-oxo-dGTP pyrophosphatase MutT (NUDIX family)
MIWKPNVTVAAVIRRDGRYLLVEEDTDEGRRFNQPAGHLDSGETLLEAVAREVREETRYDFRPTGLVGVYLWPQPKKDITYLRFAFRGEMIGHDPSRELDTGIVAARWMTPEEIAAVASQHRSPLIAQCIADFEAGHDHPLAMLHHYPD